MQKAIFTKYLLLCLLDESCTTSGEEEGIQRLTVARSGSVQCQSLWLLVQTKASGCIQGFFLLDIHVYTEQQKTERGKEPCRK